MEKTIYNIYNRASDEIAEKWYKYMESQEKGLRSAYNALQDALKSGDKDSIDKAKSDYERKVKNVTLNSDRYKAMLNETTAKLTHVNEVALDYANGNMPKIYTLNYNEFANQDITGYTFTLVNEQAVKNLAAEDKSLLPKKKVDIPKDKAWNQKNINSEVLQGILQGENINKIANRLQHVTDMNRNSSIRNARTMVTSAENKGRQDSFKKAANDGVIMKRRWVATHDDRTRAWHSDLDGVEVDLDEPWENDYGEIMYPGDPTADPANVYNCRCSIRSVVTGFKWNEEKATETNLTAAWKSDPETFDLPIDDIIHAQGFDGLPQVLYGDDFDNALNKSQLLLQRSYDAPSEEVLKSYAEALRTGDFYVSATRGSVYGSGMYTAGVKGTKETSWLKQQVSSYGTEQSYRKVETMTLIPDAKIININELGSKGLTLYDDMVKSYIEKQNLTSLEKQFEIFVNTSSGGDYLDIFDKISPKRKEEIYDQIKGDLLDLSLKATDMLKDNGVFATAMGYDALEINQGEGSYYVVYNRTKLIIKGD